MSMNAFYGPYIVTLNEVWCLLVYSDIHQSMLPNLLWQNIWLKKLYLLVHGLVNCWYWWRDRNKLKLCWHPYGGFEVTVTIPTLKDVSSLLEDQWGRFVLWMPVITHELRSGISSSRAVNLPLSLACFLAYQVKASNNTNFFWEVRGPNSGQCPQTRPCFPLLSHSPGLILVLTSLMIQPKDSKRLLL